MNKKMLIMVAATVLISGCNSENIKYASKNEKSMALMQQCKWDSELDNKPSMYFSTLVDIYHANCNWITSPEVAHKIYKKGYNILGFHPSRLKYLPK